MAGWVSLGPADVDGKQAHMWQLKEMQGEKVNTYTFYVAEVRTANKQYCSISISESAFHTCTAALCCGDKAM
jgi:hypothetical protein